MTEQEGTLGRHIANQAKSISKKTGWSQEGAEKLLRHLYEQSLGEQFDMNYDLGSPLSWSPQLPDISNFILEIGAEETEQLFLKNPLPEIERIGGVCGQFLFTYHAATEIGDLSSWMEMFVADTSELKDVMEPGDALEMLFHRLAVRPKIPRIDKDEFVLGKIRTSIKSIGANESDVGFMKSESLESKFQNLRRSLCKALLEENPEPIGDYIDAVETAGIPIEEAALLRSIEHYFTLKQGKELNLFSASNELVEWHMFLSKSNLTERIQAITDIPIESLARLSFSLYSDYEAVLSLAHEFGEKWSNAASLIEKCWIEFSKERVAIGLEIASAFGENQNRSGINLIKYGEDFQLSTADNMLVWRNKSYRLSKTMREILSAFFDEGIFRGPLTYKEVFDEIGIEDPFDYFKKSLQVKTLIGSTTKPDAISENTLLIKDTRLKQYRLNLK